MSRITGTTISEKLCFNLFTGILRPYNAFKGLLKAFKKAFQCLYTQTVILANSILVNLERPNRYENPGTTRKRREKPENNSRTTKNNSEQPTENHLIATQSQPNSAIGAF